MMRHTRMLGLVAAAALAVTAVGCSTPAGGEGVTLTIWHNTQDPEAILNTYAAYEEATGNRIELVPITSDGFEEATLAKWATGDRPDVLEFHGMSSYIAMLNPTQNLQDLSSMDFVNRSGDLYDIGGRGADGKVYAAITNFPEVWGLYYNKSLLAEHGLEPAGTIDELLEQCTLLSAAGITTLAEAGASGWPPVAVTAIVSGTLADADWASRIVDRSTTLDAADSPLLRGLEVYQDLLDRGCANSDITSATFESAVASVVSGEAAYQAIHSNIAPVYLDAVGGDAAQLGSTIGFSALGAQVQTAVLNPGVIGTYLLPKTGDDAREAAAREFLDFVTGDHYATYIEESGTFPVLQGVADPSAATPLLLEIKAAYDGPVSGMIFGSLPGGLSGIFPLLSELIVGQRSPEQLATTLQTQLSDAARAQGIEGW